MGKDRGAFCVSLRDRYAASKAMPACLFVSRVAVGLLVLTTAFFPSTSDAANCYPSSILSPTPFMGNDGEIFRLTDGSIWKVEYEYEYMYEYYPDVVICPGSGKLLIKGKSLNVQQLSGTPPTPLSPRQFSSPEVVESYIDGEFTGWEGDTIFRLDNGQIWQQVGYSYLYAYKYHPRVLIFPNGGSYEMQVEGVDTRIRVTRLN